MTPDPRQLRLLLVTGYYPYPGNPISGIFNERSAEALAAQCRWLEVLSPRPFVPSSLRARHPRWNGYASIPSFEERNGIPVHRPAYVQLPGNWGAGWSEWARFAMSRAVVRERHSVSSFDAIPSFDLRGGGALAWKLGKALGLFAAGWATGGDIRVANDPGAARRVARTLRELDLVFYQSAELKGLSAEVQEMRSVADLDPERHIVLPRGIPEPPRNNREASRARWRAEWAIASDEVLVLYAGRITRAKGIYELLEVAARTVAAGSRLCFVAVGATPGLDESAELTRCTAEIPALRGRFTVLPACPPGDMWGILGAADLFAFPSHAEGMPNGLLEALAMELPAVAFDIAAVREIDPRGDFIVTAPPFEPGPFAEALDALARSPDERRRRGRIGRERVLADFLISRNMRKALDRIAVLVDRRRIPRSPAALRGRAAAS